MQQPEPESRSQRVVVVVVRTGGIHGLRKEWRAEPPAREASSWIALIDDCPWSDPAHDGAGADRYVWSIHAVHDDDERQAELPDSRLDGPWRALVDRVRESAAPRNARPHRSA